MTRVWDRIWERFVAAVEGLNAIVRPHDRGFVSRIERSSNDTFPLRAIVSYSPIAAPGDEQLVVSVDFKREGSAVVGHADIARGDGSVLDDKEILPAIAEDTITTSPAEMHVVELAIEAFVAHHYDLVLSELSE